ncbi:MAG: hypothetical protein M3453_16675 [Pseudomonadota bacterium]|nr:hypothetical protein [Pseudomonadota bacterium]
MRQVRACKRSAQGKPKQNLNPGSPIREQIVSASVRTLSRADIFLEKLDPLFSNNVFAAGPKTQERKLKAWPGERPGQGERGNEKSRRQPCQGEDKPSREEMNQVRDETHRSRSPDRPAKDSLRLRSCRRLAHGPYTAQRFLEPKRSFASLT